MGWGVRLAGCRLECERRGRACEVARTKTPTEFRWVSSVEPTGIEPVTS